MDQNQELGKLLEKIATAFKSGELSQDDEDKLRGRMLRFAFGFPEAQQEEEPYLVQTFGCCVDQAPINYNSYLRLIPDGDKIVVHGVSFDHARPDEPGELQFSITYDPQQDESESPVTLEDMKSRVSRAFFQSGTDRMWVSGPTTGEETVLAE